MLIPFGRSCFDTDAHKLNLGLLNCLDQVDPASYLVANYFDLTEPGESVSYYPETSRAPRTLLVQGATTPVYILGGVKATPLAEQFIASFASLPSVADPAEVNPMWTVAAGDRYAALTDPAKLAAQKFVFIGHSFGGACLDELALRCTGHAGPGAAEIWDYGSPRNCVRRAVSTYLPLTRWRTWNANDPVVRFPTHTSEAPVMAAVVTPLVSLQWNHQIQRNNGVVVFPDGSLNVGAASEGPIASQDFKFLDWLFGSNILGSPNHSLASYITNVSAGSTHGHIPSVPQSAVDVGSDPQGAEPPRARQQIAAGVRAIGAVLTADRNQLLTQVTNTLGGAPSGRFHRTRVPGGYAISLGDQVVSFAPGKRAAKKQIKYLNSIALKT